MWAPARLIHRLGRTQRQVASLVLVPALLLSTVPQPICRCDRGGTQRGWGHAPCSARRTERAPAAGCRCPCCSSTHAERQLVCCRKTGTSRPNDLRSAEQPAAVYAALMAQRCCQQQVPAPGPTVMAIPDAWASVLALAPRMIWPDLEAAPSARPVHPVQVTSIPPPDRIIWFLHLTI